MSLKLFYHTSERNGNAKLWATPFPKTWGKGGFGTNWPTKVVVIATLYEFDENDRLITTSCDPYMGHILVLFFYLFPHKKDTKDGFQEKCLK